VSTPIAPGGLIPLPVTRRCTADGSATTASRHDETLAGGTWNSKNSQDIRVAVRDPLLVDADRLRELLDLVEASVEEPELSGDALAGRAYLSRFHFDRIVRDALGEAPGQFRRRLLLERAATQLATGRATVLEIALSAGYGGPEAFTRAFSRAFGMPPTVYRHSQTLEFRLEAASGVHFHPPGGLRLPAQNRSDPMDTLSQMLDHHLWMTGEILDRCGQVDGSVLDLPISLSVEGIDRKPTLRALATRLVTQLEMWIAAINGATTVPADGDRTPAALRARLDVAAPSFRGLVCGPIRDGRGGETFLDATCNPPRMFTLGGVLAHVLTFSAVRRTMAIGALTAAGIDDLGSGDPMTHVNGHGEDASQIRRNQ
jgi:AraC family transcriptional regulator